MHNTGSVLQSQLYRKHKYNLAKFGDTNKIIQRVLKKVKQEFREVRKNRFNCQPSKTQSYYIVGTRIYAHRGMIIFRNVDRKICLYYQFPNFYQSGYTFPLSVTDEAVAKL